ncbi:MAG: hypothetical protein HRT58_14090 [Crocinitomicaceae bacterium]|nr:hypothetical protein [Flavobacteriales bacterium]NQZ36795.1 hypothetical protein [Crocinitomicaceae bacterium]
MKNLKLLIAFTAIVSGFTVFAQPSDATVKAKATSNGSKFVEFSGTGKIHNNLSETWYIRVVVTKKATEHPGVYHIIAAEYKYLKSGGSWKYDRSFGWWDEYEGIPNPSEEEVIAFIKTDLHELVGGAYSYIIGDIGEIKLTEKSNWKWSGLATVKFTIVTSFNRKFNSTQVGNYVEEYEVVMSADKFQGSWKSFYTLKKQSPKPTNVKTYSAEELRAIPTLLSIDQERRALEAIAHLPKIEVPEFEYDKALIAYTHNMLRTATRDEMEAFLRKTFSKSNYAEHSTVILSKWGEGIMNGVLANAFDGESTYKDQYCEHPAVKHEQQNMMELWNKLQNRKTRIAVTFENGTYKISDIQAYVFSSGSSIAEVESGTNCGNPIATEPLVIEQYAIGTKVEVKKSGHWVKATISKKDNMFDNRYYVNYAISGGAWVNNDVIRRINSSNPAVETGESSSETTPTQTKQTEASTVDQEKKDSVTTKTKGKLKNLKKKIKFP